MLCLQAPVTSPVPPHPMRWSLLFYASAVAAP